MATDTKRRPRAKTKTADGAVVKDMLPTTDIVLDSDVQPRENISTATINEYAEAMREGSEFPEIIVYRDPETGVLIAADGWHRVMAAKEADKVTIAAEVREGTKRDAILYSVSANATHGLRRTNDDKRRAVFRMLDDEEWSSWTDSAIAEKVGVSQPFVSTLRSKRDSESGAASPRKRVASDGRKIDTSNIGGGSTGRKKKDAAPEPVEVTNGHEPSGLGLVPDLEDDEDEAPNVTETTSNELSGPMTLTQFAARFAEMMLQIGDHDATDVFEAMDTDTRDALADKWDDIIGAFDKYSDALEAALEGSTV